MTRVHVELEATVEVTGRLAVAASSMDHPVEPTTRTVLDVDMPLDAKPWTVGLIVGPSGAGKTSIANQLWPDAISAESRLVWPRERARVDAFPDELTASDVTKLLGRVGLGSVPAWLRPYHALSNGEQFRARMAMLLADAQLRGVYAASDSPEPVVVDEFTSVVDRQVGRVVSHSVAKAAREIGQPFVAVTCHYDVEEWLQPDWVLDVAARSFTWRSVQARPRVELDIHRVPVAAWRLFRPHHYLSAEHLTSATSFVAFHQDRPVAWTSYRHFPHPKTRNVKMGHRLVVLPDWQGLGIAAQLEEWLGEHLAAQGFRYRNAVAHPAMKALYGRSPRWRRGNVGQPVTANKGHGSNTRQLAATHRTVRQAGVVSYEYQPKPKETRS